MILILQMYMGLSSLILLLSIEGMVENYAVSFLLSQTGYGFETLNTNSFCKNLGQFFITPIPRVVQYTRTESGRMTFKLTRLPEVRLWI